MRKLLTVTFAAAALALMAAPAAVQAQKLGFIDSRRIIAEAPGSKEAQDAHLGFLLAWVRDARERLRP